MSWLAVGIVTLPWGVQGVGISPEETMLLVVNPPQENIDQFRIRQTEELMAARVESIQDQLA